jgi:hypothetical protein
LVEEKVPIFFAVLLLKVRYICRLLPRTLLRRTLPASNGRPSGAVN